MYSKAWPSGYWHLFGEPSQLQMWRDLQRGRKEILKIKITLWIVAGLEAVPQQNHLLKSPSHWTQNTQNVYPALTTCQGLSFTAAKRREEWEKRIQVDLNNLNNIWRHELQIPYNRSLIQAKILYEEKQQGLYCLLWSRLLKINPWSSATDPTAEVNSGLPDLLAIQTSLWKLQEIKVHL